MELIRRLERGESFVEYWSVMREEFSHLEWKTSHSKLSLEPASIDFRLWSIKGRASQSALRALFLWGRSKGFYRRLIEPADREFQVHLNLSSECMQDILSGMIKDWRIGTRLPENIRLSLIPPLVLLQRRNRNSGARLTIVPLKRSLWEGYAALYS